MTCNVKTRGQNLLGFSVFLQRQFNQTVTMASNPSLSDLMLSRFEDRNITFCRSLVIRNRKQLSYHLTESSEGLVILILITSLFIIAFSVSRLKKAVLVWHLKLYFTNREFRNRIRKDFCDLPRFESRSVSYELA